MLWLHVRERLNFLAGSGLSSLGPKVPPPVGPRAPDRPEGLRCRSCGSAPVVTPSCTMKVLFQAGLDGPVPAPPGKRFLINYKYDAMNHQ